jgi:protein-L-isoaspartate(D-aspartate) O-methyltransferase
MMGEMNRGEATNANLIARLKASQTLLSENIEQAYLDIPREYFVTADLKDEAYVDHPLRFSKMGFNISAPHMYTLCLENLGIKAGDKILDIGSGCGYFTVLAGYLCGPTGLVHGLDLYDHIIEFAQNNVKSFLNDEKGASLGKTFDHVKFFKRNCFLPTIDNILYDKIHVGACCPDAKIQELYNILAPGGVLVTPYGDRLIRAEKGADGKVNVQTLVEVRYSDLLLPSSAEIKEAQKEIEIANASRIIVPPNNRDIQLAAMVNNKLCSDILFEVQSRPIYAHKIVFALQSPKFFQKIEGEKVVRLDDGFSSESILSMLHFLYTGAFTALPEYWSEIMKLAECCQIDNLLQIVNAKLNNQPPLQVPTFDSAMCQLMGKETFADVKFSVEDKIIPGHKFVLVAHSEHFRKMFAGTYKESVDGVIKIYDCTLDVFHEILDFLYTGNVNITEDNCFGILEQGNFFQLPRLIALCELFWYEHISIENAANVLAFADHFNASQLKQFAMEYIFSHVNDVIKTTHWKELDIDLISSVLVASVERSK